MSNNFRMFFKLQELSINSIQAQKTKTIVTHDATNTEIFNESITLELKKFRFEQLISNQHSRQAQLKQITHIKRT